ncbi:MULTISPECIES: hypothetical protein [Pseudomonas]|uniref:hypothetical protein n=1 Tax=Pseudomonas TaxID=286 RepID=UPI000C0E639A|nr:hypothetical protein [Pseudomonadaceae bacterium]HCP54668.1 hypothetical protein [Pseudomonas sp.]|tara:strand:- start:5465 stop:6880 length:1416 start_codon:yes stop_codon:yes gene_type:complete
MDSFLHATLGTFFTPRLEMRLYDRAEKFTVDSATNGNLLTYFHEHVHLFQALFTGYGHIQWSSHRQATGYTGRKWRELWPAMNGPRLPLSNCNSDLKVNFGAWQLYQVYIEQNKIAQARYTVNTTTNSISSLGLFTIKSDWKINPIIETQDGYRALCTKEILEGHAHFLERSIAVAILSFPQMAAESREGLNEIYTIAFDWFIKECGAEQRHIFPVICDLALQTSWDPVVPRNEHEWQSTNPSWRFYLLTKALASSPDLSLGKHDTWQDQYVDFCNFLTDKCNFHRLENILSERLNALHLLEKSPGLSPLQRTMKTAMEHRIKTPWLTVNPTESNCELERLFEKFRIPAVLVEGRFQVQSLLEEDVSVELIGELHFQAFIDQLLGNASPLVKDSNELQCGFSRYDVPNGCPFLVSGDCMGRINPRDGLPVPLNLDENGVVHGCTFGTLFLSWGIGIKDVDVDYSTRFREFS